MSLFAHFLIVSYQFWIPLGQSINKYTAHLGELNTGQSLLSCADPEKGEGGRRSGPRGE